MWILIGIDVLTVHVEVAQLLRVSVVARQSFLDGVGLVARVHFKPLFDLRCGRGVVEQVVAFARHGVGRSEGESLDYRVVGDIQAEYPERDGMLL